MSNFTNSTGDPVPHDTDYDALTAFWVAFFFLFVIGAVFAVPLYMEPAWYTPYGASTTRYAVVNRPPQVVQPQEVPQAMVVVPGTPVPPTTVVTNATSSPGGAILECRPNLSGMKA